MKNIIITKISILLFIFAFILLINSGCEGPFDESDYYNFKVISTGNGFSGYYSVDGEEENGIGNDEIIDPDYYAFELNLENPGFIRIHVDGADNTTTYITIEVYQNSILVASEESSQEDSEKVSVTLSHTFEESIDSESDF